MLYLTWLDSNSWLIELNGLRVLLDPWLVGPLMFGNLPWLFKSEKRSPQPIPRDIDLILLSQGLEDHAHPPTLAQLDRQIPVVGSPAAAKVARSLGYLQVTALEHGQRFTLADRLTIQATPGSPIGPQTVENGYYLQESSRGISLYYEPHGFHADSIQDLAPVDVVITPIVDLLLLFAPIIQGASTALKAVQWLKPQVILPTAAGGDVSFEGVLLSLIRARGGADEFRNQLAQTGCGTQLLEPKPGERLAISLSKSVAA